MGSNDEVGSNYDQSDEEPTSIQSPTLKRCPQTAARVRRDATDTVFRAVKFLNTENLIRIAMNKLSAMNNIPEDFRFEWELLYQKDLCFAINNKRNTVAQDVRYKLKGNCFVLN